MPEVTFAVGFVGIMLRATRPLGPALRAYAKFEIARTPRPYNSLKRQRQTGNYSTLPFPGTLMTNLFVGTTGPRQRILSQAQVARPPRVATAAEPLDNFNGSQRQSSRHEALVQHDAKLCEDPAAKQVSIPTASEAV